MAKKVSPVVRLLVPLVGLLLCLGVAWAVFVNSGKQNAKTNEVRPADTKATDTKVAATPADGSAGTNTGAPTQPKPEAKTEAKPEAKREQAAAAQTTPAAPAKGDNAFSVAALHPQVFAGEPLAMVFAPLGSIDGANQFKAQVEFADIGAGIRRLTLAEHYVSVDKKEKVALQSEAAQNELTLTPFAALGVQITDPATKQSQFIPLARGGKTPGPVWRQVASDKPGQFEAFVLDQNDRKVLRVTRTYTLKPNSYDLEVSQHIENLSGQKLAVRWYQFGPSDLPKDNSGYGGDTRRLRFGHLLSDQVDPTGQIVQSSDYLIPHQNALGSRDRDHGVFLDSSPNWPMSADDRRAFVPPMWPNARADERKYSLVWAGMINRYFGIAVHPLVNPDDPKASLKLSSFENVGRYVFDRGVGEEVLALRMLSPTRELEPGAKTDLSFGVYAGPLAKPIINADPVAKRVGLDEMIVYNFGGLCGPCTFEFFTHGLLSLLTVLRNYLFFDWSLSIIFLVVIVRTILHPVTKWTQVRMQRFGKQMQEMAPKQKKIQERYGNDRQKMQQEMAKLWREEGVSPMGFLGCLPMFLVMPVWIALSAMLSFAQELRQQPAFYGVFQKLTGNNWHFLADLSQPDHFISFGTSFKVPLLSSLMGPISAFNIVPLILGVVFFAHQKYLTPPQTAPMTPEQEFQMKMTKWLSVIMFPVMMYNAPSGLALYFTANSTFAIVENHWIRKHIEKHDLLNPEKFKKKPGAKSNGFMARLQAAAEARMKEADTRNKKR